MDLKEILNKAQPAKVLAVSKLQPADKIRFLYSQGQRRFGENYVQEALQKQKDLADLTDIDIPVHCAHATGYETFRLSELLPHGFGPANLK